MLASLENCWYSLKELLKSVIKIRNVLVFADGTG